MLQSRQILSKFCALNQYYTVTIYISSCTNYVMIAPFVWLTALFSGIFCFINMLQFSYVSTTQRYELVPITLLSVTPVIVSALAS